MAISNQSRQKWMAYLLVGIFALSIIGYGLVRFSSIFGGSGSETTVKKRETPQFRKDSELIFKSQDTTVTIQIEIVKTESQIQQGLMYRPQMNPLDGMLFVFENEEERSFWMKNTYIPLDIIYINAQKRIVSIQKYTTPFSEQSLPSYGAAQYVVEVNAGFADQYQLKSGDVVEF